MMMGQLHLKLGVRFSWCFRRVLYLGCIVLLANCETSPPKPEMIWSKARPEVAGLAVTEVKIPKVVYQASLADQSLLNRMRPIPIYAGTDSSSSSIPEYRLFDIVPGSPAYTLGLRTGDVLLAANDFIIYEPAVFAQYLTLLGTVNTATINIRRNETPIMFKYQFVE
jgi:hypothetical protein